MSRSRADDDRPRARDADATRRALLRAAQRRFVLLGYERSTTRDIAEDAGANVALINRYFGGKRGLFEAAVSASSTELTRGEEEPLDVVASFVASLDDGSWPQFGGHPLLLLLRDDGAGDEIRVLRARALSSIAEQLGRRIADDGSADALRAQLVLALFCGVVALRASGSVEPLGSVDAETLGRALEEVVDAIAG